MTPPSASNTPANPVAYRGTCDASAAVLVGAASLIAACDEDAVIRVFDRRSPGMPTSTLDVTEFLEPLDASKEPDLEGAARVGDRIYWITSHGQDKNAALQESRHRFFATDIGESGGRVTLRPVGAPYKKLRSDVVALPALESLGLDKAATRAPEAEGGFNIEGLAPTKDGDLFIGFRNPIPDGLALIVCLRNAAALVEQRATKAELEIAGRLDLGGRGIRAIEFVPGASVYLVIAGPPGDVGDFALYAWRGGTTDAAVELPVNFGGLKPEELVVAGVRGRDVDVELLSDDGDRVDGGKKCKKLAPEKQSFRALRATVRV